MGEGQVLSTLGQAYFVRWDTKIPDGFSANTAYMGIPSPQII